MPVSVSTKRVQYSTMGNDDNNEAALSESPKFPDPATSESATAQLSTAAKLELNVER